MKSKIFLLAFLLVSLASAQSQNRYYFNYNYLGGWENKYGVPDYLEAERDNFSPEFIDRVNSILIPRRYLPSRHPELFEEGASNTIRLKEEGDVYLSFFKETAGFRNAIGFYSYNPSDYPDTDKAVIFNGTNQFGKIPYYEAMDTKELTAEFWIYPINDNRFSILRREDVFSIYSSYGRIYVDVGGSQIISTSKLVNRAWNHVAVVIQNRTSGRGADVKIYLNGNYNVKSGTGTELKSSTNELTVGWWGTNWYMNGAIDELVLYNKALTKEQVNERFNEFKGTIKLPTGVNESQDVIARFSFRNVGDATENECTLGSGHDMILYNSPEQMQGVLGHPPVSAFDLFDHGITIVFPNYSAHRSGGNLYLGDKVKLGHFEAGTVIGFFVYANGYANRYIRNEFIDYRNSYFSDDDYNPESSNYNRHWVMFRDNPSGKLILGVEDLLRPWGDNDFDDATFVLTANPSNAIDQSNIIGFGEQPEDPKVDISLVQSVSNTEPEDGDEIAFEITASNDGPANATNVNICSKLPKGLVYLSHSATTGVYDTATSLWQIPELAKGASVKLKITALVSLDDLSQSAFDLKYAKDYNVFILNDIYLTSADVEGRVAVGNEGVFESYTIGYEIEDADSTLPALLSGYNITYLSGNVFNGNVVYGHETNLPDSNVGITNGEIKQDSLIDFSEVESYFLSLSNTLKEYEENGKVEMTYSQLAMTGTKPFLNVFNVDGKDLTNATETVISVPNGSVTLVNISGDSIKWSGGLVVSGTDISNVMYNFYEAKTITIQGIDVTGSILAPKASVNFISGVQNGQMIAKNLEGASQYNIAPFVGLIYSDSVLVNIAEVVSIDQEDVDSKPGNGVEDEDDYAAVSISFKTENVINNTGVSWEFVGNSANGNIIWSLAYDKDNYLISGNWGGGIYRSTDEGVSWTRLNPDMQVSYIWSLAIVDDYLYAGTDRGIYLSPDNGENWEKVLELNVDVRDIQIYNGNVYAATWGSGMYKSSVGNSDWTEYSNDIAAIPITSLVVLSDKEIVLGSFDSGIWKTTDGGETWLQKPFDYRFVWALIKHPKGYLFAGTYGNGVYSSIDNGETWQKDFGVTARYIYNFSVDGGNNLYANSWMSGIFLAADDGSDWNVANLRNTDNNSNAGANWRNIGLENQSVITILSGNNPGELIATTEDGAIYRTSNALVKIQDNNNSAYKYELLQNYPNPFNPSTTISFSIKEPGNTKLIIYDALGRKIKELFNKELTPGNYKYNFNALSSELNLPSGVYFYRLISGNYVEVKKMLLLK